MTLSKANRGLRESGAKWALALPPPLAILCIVRLDKSSGRSTGKSNDCPAPISLAINRGVGTIRQRIRKDFFLFSTTEREGNWTSMDGYIERRGYIQHRIITRYTLSLPPLERLSCPSLSHGSFDVRRAQDL